ncbi:MAG: aminotransferase class V-fold PLP-dependent enzyme [Candidatus Comchoanobacterales bacterium]
MAEMTVAQVRDQFPIFSSSEHTKPLIYLDSAATTQRPYEVIDGMRSFDMHHNAPAHRGLYDLGYRATQFFEEARFKIAQFLGSHDPQSWVFTSGATASINMVAQSYLAPRVQPGDEIIITELEHHANIIPWLMLKQNKGLVIRVAPVDQHGHLDLEAFQKLLNTRTRLVATSHVSNVTGVVMPVEAMTQLAHQAGVPILLDGAQAAAHIEVNVTAIDCDFYVASAHKMYGPTGVGILYAKSHLWSQMQPCKGGGHMVHEVSFDDFSYLTAPAGFEPGTQPYVQAYGWSLAIDFLNGLSMKAVIDHDRALKNYLVNQLSAIEGIHLYGGLQDHVGVVSFVIDEVHPHDVATILDQHGVAIRAGHHCAMPFMRKLDVPALSRVSLGIYNTRNDIDSLIQGLANVKEVFSE